MHTVAFAVTAATFLLVGVGPRPLSAQEAPRNLSSLTLEQLADIQTTTSTRVPTELSKVPAAVFVITQEDIRRSGVRSLPEALRLAPGVQVARIDANKWAVGLRGFGSRLSRSMLVLLDGRAVYTPLFAGTYWEVQDTLLEDVERIEVVLGPGGTLWGANAVNGVVNIITRQAADTVGMLFAADTGSHERGAARFRFGSRIGEDSYYRVYGKFFTRDPVFHAGGPKFDGWQMGQTGFRADWNVPEGRKLTIQGDAYVGAAGQRSTLTVQSPPSTQVVHDDANFSGGNVLGRWGGPVGRSDIRLQWFYDRTNRTEPTFQEHRDTVDVDFQHRLPGLGAQQFLWGGGYRVSSGEFRGVVDTLRFVPDRRTDQLLTWFGQDDIEVLANHLHVILGSKFEHNDYTGFEAQPSARFVWTPTTQQSVSGSVSRAVRTPSRIERDMEATSLVSTSPTPTFSRLLSSAVFQSEQVVAYELQYRAQPASSVLFAATPFFNRYEDLLSIEVGAAIPGSQEIVIPVTFANGLHGKSHGIELMATVEVASPWRVTGGYSYVNIDLAADVNSGDTSTAVSMEGSTPRHQAFVRSSMNLSGRMELDWTLRAVSALSAPAQRVPRYQTSDVRLAWNAMRAVTLAIVAQNLHAPRHLEFVNGGIRSEVERSLFGSVTWQW